MPVDKVNQKLKIPVCESELKVLACLWEKGPMTAKKLSSLLEEKVNWKKTTSYTVIKNCVHKGLISRSEPNYLCEAKLTKAEVQWGEIMLLADKMFDGSIDRMAMILN
jgi:predicted transcriptional regulator